MITPSIGSVLWSRWGLWPPVAAAATRTTATVPDAVVIERLNRAFGRIKSYERIGLGDETLRELDALPLAVRELPSNQLRRGRVLERLERFAEAIKIYDQMEPSTLSQLGRVRCLSHLGRRAEAARFLDKIPFDPAVVREFVEARDSLR